MADNGALEPELGVDAPIDGDPPEAGADQGAVDENGAETPVEGAAPERDVEAASGVDVTVEASPDVPDAAGSDAVVPIDEADQPRPLTNGICPLCEAEFDDRGAFRNHLRDEHDLEDDEGTESDFIPAYSTPKTDDEPSALALAGADPAAKAAMAAAAAAALAEFEEEERAERRRKIGYVLVGIVALFAIIGAAMALGGSGGKSTFSAADDGTGSANINVIPAAAAPGLPGAAAPADGTDQTAADGTPLAGAAPAGPDAPAPDAASDPGVVAYPPADTPPVSTVPQPPAPFAAPTTTAAKIDSCSRDHGRWSVTYSWQYIGGASWTPLGSYKSLGSGRYQDNMLLKNGSSITTVQVVDPSGSLHTITLNPALSTNNC